MRTTVTLDPDVERLLKKAAHERGKSFKVVLNEAVRQSLGRKRPLSKPTLLPAVPLSLRPGIDPQRLTQFADDLEVNSFLASTNELLKIRNAQTNDHS